MEEYELYDSSNQIDDNIIDQPDFLSLSQLVFWPGSLC
jgi:hypothetical protein